MLSPLGMEMFKWYCVELSGHAEERPCQVYSHMQRRQNAKNAHEMKTVDEEGKAAMAQLGEGGKRQFWSETRKGFVKVYHSYCAQTPPPNPAICSDMTIKRIAQSFAK